MSDRPANISPSQIHRLMAKRGLGKGAETYADEIIQRAMGIEMDDYLSWDMEWGVLHEPLAIRAYEEKYLVTVQQKDRATHPYYRFISGEADGLVGTNGGVEVKCPSSKYHLRNLRGGEWVDEYLKKSGYDYQIQSYMWIHGRSWWDFISYDPRFPDGKKLYVQRIHRDQAVIDLIEERCIEFWGLVRDRWRQDMDYPTKVVQWEADEIRKAYNDEAITMRSLAIEFGVSVSTISAIIRNKIYTNNGD